MTERIKIELQPSPAEKMRERCAKIAAVEAQYWAEIDGDERLLNISIGALGAAANICAAILDGTTPEQHKADCAARSERRIP